MKFHKRKWIILGLTFLGILAVLALLFADVFKSSTESALKIMADNVDLQVKNVVYTDIGRSGEKWEIRADTARYARKENLAFFDVVKVKFVTGEGKTFLMTGQRAKLHTDSKNIEISGNVEVLSERGDRFRTDRLRYTHADGTVHTDGAVTFWSDQMQIRGTGMILDLKQGQLSLKSGVKGQVQAR